ncbi:MAG: MarR family transcriptional regulator [Lachnospiraceae bacterium]|nr:MarR family transcriptional regulator [Lachnospiraceae bacterium]
MKDYEFFDFTYRIINKYNNKSKRPKYYGTEHLLYLSEVHMIEVIGEHRCLTATQIAQLQGITKGAVSQTTNKLSKKGLIKKEVSPIGNNEISISLTDSGKIVYDNHLKYHKDLITAVSSLVNELPNESLNILKQILSIIDEELDTY